MHPLAKKISTAWPFILCIAIGIGLTSLALFLIAGNGTDYPCQLAFQRCADNPLADCMGDCSVKQIDLVSFRWLTLASLPVFLIALVLGVMHQDAKRT